MYLSYVFSTYVDYNTKSIHEKNYIKNYYVTCNKIIMLQQ